MTTGRKRWWRAAAIAAVGGVAVTGGWFGLVRAKSPTSPELPGDATDWARAAAPAPSIAEVDRSADAETPPAPVTVPGQVVPAGATLPPIPLSGGSDPVGPAASVPPPVVLPAAPLPVPSLPSVPAPVEPASGPRALDAGLTGGVALPAVPALPTLPPVALPDLSVPPKPPMPKDAVPMPPVAPVTPSTLPMPPVAPVAPVTPPAPVTPGGPVLPALPPVPSAAEPPKAPMPLTPVTPPAQPVEPVQPIVPVKPNSDLKPINPPNTLNPTVAPAVPVVPGVGRDTPGLPVDRSKPPQPPFDPTEKFVLPVKPIAPVATPRDDTMLNLTTAAAFAVFGAAISAAEKASPIPAAPVVPMTAAAPLKADDKVDVEKLKADLATANNKIEALEKQVKRLEDLLTGKKELDGKTLLDPNAPGAVEDVKALKSKIAAMQKEIDSLKTQTALKPAVLPEAKPKGVVRVVNEYPVEIAMVINDKSYRIAPNTKLDVDVPAGEFTYQLLPSAAVATTSKIKDKETVTLRIK